MSEELYTQHLVKLMAKENLSLTFSPSVATAAMNLKDRTIVVNSYLNNFNTNVLAFERLLCHEVGHALYSDPDEYMEKSSKFDKELVNVFEDIRVENLLKLKFPGLRKLFGTGFYELDKLLETKFGMPICSELNSKSHFLDRMNIYFKSNHSHPINFSDKEFTFIQKLKKFTDHEDMEPIIIEFLTNFGSDSKQSQIENNTSNFSGTESESEDYEYVNSMDEENRESGDSGEYEKIGSASVIDSSLEDTLKEIQSNLKDTLSYKEENFFKELKSSTGKKDSTVVEVEQTQPNIIYNKDITKFIRERLDIIPNDQYDYIRSEIDKMLSGADKSAQLLYTEFERAKNARNFRFQHQVKTGELNLKRLHQYKTSSALFKQLSIKPKQKNHEVIVLLDWSSSIRSNLTDLIKESITIVKFCKKANIPCSVYAFVNNNSIRFVAESITGSLKEHEPWLVEMLNGNSDTLSTDCFNLLLLGTLVSGKLYVSHKYTGNCKARELYYLTLGKTPLEYALFNLPPLLRGCVGSNKRICLAIISDGESDSVTLYGSNSSQQRYSDRILTNTPFIDPLSKSITMFKDRNRFLYSRLKVAFPTLSILTIHIADSIRTAIYNNGFIDETTRSLTSEISEKLSKSNVYFTHLEHYDHLIIKTKEVKPIEFNSVDLKKSNIKKLLQSELHPMSKYIYKQIASCMA